MAKPVIPRIERVCEECKAVFIVELGDFGRKYCSKTCYRKKFQRETNRQLKSQQKVG